MTNIIISSLKQSFSLITKHKKVILNLLILQIFFLVIIFSVQTYYQSQAMDVAQDIMLYLGQQDLGDAAVAENIVMGQGLLGDDPMMIARNYKIILGYVTKMAIYSLIIFLVFQSLAWALTDQMVHKKNKKKFLGYIRNFCIIAASFLVLSVVWMILGLKGLVAETLSEARLSFTSLSFFILTIAVIYFMFVCFALISKVKSKDILAAAWAVGGKKAHIILPVVLINVAAIALTTYLAGLMSEKNIFLLLIALILWVFSFIWARIMLILAVDKLKA